MGVPNKGGAGCKKAKAMHSEGSEAKQAGVANRRVEENRLLCIVQTPHRIGNKVDECINETKIDGIAKEYAHIEVCG